MLLTDFLHSIIANYRARFQNVVRLCVLLNLVNFFCGCNSGSPNPLATATPNDSGKAIEQVVLPDYPDTSGGPLLVGFVITDGVYNSELMAPFDIFHHTIFHTQPGMKVFTVAEKPEVVTSFEGIRLLPDYTFDHCPPIDILVVPSAEHSMDTDLENNTLIDFVHESGSQADFIVSLCDGAFVLAQAGLLDSLECTTFPGDIDAFRQKFPHLTVHEEVSFVHDGPAITSAGGAKSYDPAMYLVKHLYGEKVVAGVGRGMVIEWDSVAVRHVVVPPTYD